MKYVNVIRRIIKIDTVLQKIPCDEKYDNVWELLCDRRDYLVKSIREYMKCPDRTNQELRKASYQRKKQIKKTCELLKVNYYRVIR